MTDEQNPLFLLRPGVFLNDRVQVVMPSFAALFSNSTFQLLGNLSPLVRPELRDQKDDQSVLLLRPRSLHELRVEDLLPAMQALHIGSPRQRFGYFLPIAPAVL